MVSDSQRFQALLFKFEHCKTNDHLVSAGKCDSDAETRNFWQQFTVQNKKMLYSFVKQNFVEMKDFEQPVKPAVEFVFDFWTPDQQKTKFDLKLASHEASFQNDALGMFPVAPEEHSFLRVEKVQKHAS